MYKKSAELGNAEAQAYLGAMFENGHGVTLDPIMAYVWYARAQSAGNEVGRTALFALEPRLLPSQLKEAKRRLAANK